MSAGPGEGRTLTVPQGGGGAAEPALVVALRERDRGLVHPLPLDAPELRIGSAADCEVRIDSPYVSKLHCTCERRGGHLRVRDHGSHNGTFIDDARVDDAELAPGSRLVLAGPAAGVSLLALDGVMRAVEPVLVGALGGAAHRAIDDLFAVMLRPSGAGPDAVRADDLAILGEPGCDQEQLVAAIHLCSRRRGTPLVQLAELPQAHAAQRELVASLAGGTLVLVADERSRQVDNLARALILAPEHRLQLVVIAPTTASVAHAVGVDALARMHVIELPPLRARPDDIPPLLDAELARRGAALRFAQLDPANQRALCGYAWPGNLARLREVARWVDAIARAGSIRKAVDELGVKRSTLQGWLAEVGLVVPLVAG